jgi:hypothetical protein
LDDKKKKTLPFILLSFISLSLLVGCAKGSPLNSIEDKGPPQRDDIKSDQNQPKCEDKDGDGYKDEACDGDDCDDTNPKIHPGAEELCVSTKDMNCNKKIGQEDPECTQPPKNDTCESAIDLTDTGTFSGSTEEHKKASWRPSCTTCGTIYCAYFTYTLETQTNITVEVETSLKPLLSINSSCKRSGEIKCQQTKKLSPESSLESGTYYIIFCGKCNLDKGKYTLKISAE